METLGGTTADIGGSPVVPALDPRTPYSSRFTDYVDCLNPAVWKGKMYPTGWAGNKIEILARNHPLVWKFSALFSRSIPAGSSNA